MYRTIPVKWPLVMLALTAVFALVAALAPKAEATEVTPAQANNPTVAEAELQDNQLSWFIPNNAYYPNAIGCTVSNASFHISPNNTWPAGLDLNKNKPNVGALSWDHGGVIGNLVEPPEFDDCGVYTGFWDPMQSPSTATPPIKADLDPPLLDVDVDTQGGWTVTAMNDGENDPHVSIAVPPNGAEITIQTPLGNCVLDVAPGKAQSIFGYFDNGVAPNPSTMHVDSQVLFAESSSSQIDCNAVLGFETTSYKENYAFAQFEALYDVTANGQPVQITP